MDPSWVLLFSGKNPRFPLNFPVKLGSAPPAASPAGTMAEPTAPAFAAPAAAAATAFAAQRLPRNTIQTAAMAGRWLEFTRENDGKWMKLEEDMGDFVIFAMIFPGQFEHLTWCWTYLNIFVFTWVVFGQFKDLSRLFIVSWNDNGTGCHQRICWMENSPLSLLNVSAVKASVSDLGVDHTDLRMGHTFTSV